MAKSVRNGLNESRNDMFVLISLSVGDRVTVDARVLSMETRAFGVGQALVEEGAHCVGCLHIFADLEHHTKDRYFI